MAWGMHLDFPPEVAGGALFPYLESMANQVFGVVIGEGGAVAIVMTMSGPINAKGGEAGLKSSVATFESAAGRAMGIRLAHGMRVGAKKAVIANLHPQIVFHRLMEPDPMREAFDRKVARFRPRPGTMIIHLALESLPDWRAGDELKRFAYVHVAPDLAMMSRPSLKPPRACFRPSRCSAAGSQPRSIRVGCRPASTSSGSKSGRSATRQRCGDSISATLRPGPAPGQAPVPAICWRE
jgi:phytoene dehydrogenase-like protein